MKTKHITLIAILIALSIVGSFIQVPSPAGTVAFDSLPGYVAAGLFGPMVGGVVGSLGHILNAATKGFPLTVPSHLIIAVFMFMAMAVYGYFYNKNKITAIVLATVINGPISLIPFAFIVGKEFAISMIIPLTFASLMNILLSAVIIPQLKRVIHE